MLAYASCKPPHYAGPDSRIVHSIVTEGCEIEGSVENSVLSSSVRVGRGARVVYSILMPGCRVEDGAVVEYAIIGENAVVHAGAHVGAQPDGSEEWNVATCGPNVEVGSGAVVKPGAMLYDSVLPLLREKLDLPEAERDEYTSFITAEAKLEELCGEADSALDWGTRFQDYRISLYVSGKTRKERDEAIGRLRERVGVLRLVDGNTDALSMAIGSLRSHGATVSVAESCTGGLLSMLLTERQGASEYMLGSVTSYAAAVKMNVLGVSGRVIDEEGTVSSGCAEAMANGVRRLTGSDYSVSVTGVAGPDKDEGKDVGTVYIGLSGKDRETVSVLFRFTSWGRASIRRKAATAALILLSAYIEGEDVKAIAESWGYI